ncbi:hypothetical protein [Micromonospora echinaurantiaca]|uniref:hypothetical protein n=1 Tax=Micromonospora echinaurantiaca TaxID=47857 RepID=UPI003439DCA7
MTLDDDRADAEPPGPEAPAEQPVSRRPPAWLVLGVVAAALLVCCCSAFVGLAISWSTGLFDAPT